MAWAGVVWHAVGVVKDTVNAMRAEAMVNEEQDRIAHMRLDRHIQQPWHDRAGNELSRIRAELESIRRELEKD